MLEYNTKHLSLSELTTFLQDTKGEFPISLDLLLDLNGYAEKLHSYATFINCFNDGELVGLLCCYMNHPPTAYISNVCVKSSFQGLGIFKSMFTMLITKCAEHGFSKIRLEVDNRNVKAMYAYTAVGFVDIADKAKEYTHYMEKNV